MLWYKVWLETRMRFLSCLIGITALLAYDMYRMDAGITSPVNAAYYNSIMNGRFGRLATCWLLVVNLLAMGGLLREKAVGAASFTLGLPFGRARLVVVRGAVSLGQALALLVVPWAAIYLTGAIFGKAYAFSQALSHLLFLAGGGLPLFALAFFVSTVVEGEYTAPMMSCGIMLEISQQVPPSLNRYNPIAFMGGGGQRYSPVGLVTGRIHWVSIVVFCVLTATLLFSSVKAIERREF